MRVTELAPGQRAAGPPRPSGRMKSSRRAQSPLVGWLLTISVAVAGGGIGCGITYRQVRLSQPVQAAAGDLHVEVTGAFLDDEALEDGVGDGTALIVELTASNSGPQPWIAPASGFWCLLQVDTAHPDQTLMLPPSIDGQGPFPGQPPEPPELKPIEVPAGQTRAFWVLFRGYRFAGSDIERRVTLNVPGIDGHPIELRQYVVERRCIDLGRRLAFEQHTADAGPSSHRLARHRIERDMERHHERRPFGQHACGVVQ